MSMHRLRAAFEVRAGVVPGHPILDYTKRFFYTEADYEKDGALPPMPEGHKLDMNGPLDQPHMSIFTARLIEATQYMQGLIHPSRVNWVDMNWIWY